jgi:predicted RNA-binding Zn-ribbon protein involved in translation (DUF1610 family)
MMSGPIKRLPKWLDRAGFEADKMMRANRVRSEANRLRDQAEDKTHALGMRVLEMASEGTELEASLQAIVDEILTLRGEAAHKDDEAKAINGEQWVEPVAPVAVSSPSVGASAAPADPIAKRLQAYVDSKSSDFNCPSCGSLIRSNASFCPKCGRKVIR